MGILRKFELRIACTAAETSRRDFKPKYRNGVTVTVYLMHGNPSCAWRGGRVGARLAGGEGLVRASPPLRRAERPFDG